MTAAASIAAMLGEVDGFGLAELEYALTLKLVKPETPADRRVAELGALAQLLRELDPELELDPPPLSREQYDERRALHNPNAPQAATLAANYGGWHAAKRAAHGLLPDGRYVGTSSPWRSSEFGSNLAPFSRDEVHASIRRCAIELGRMPSSGNYHWWSREKRRKLRAAGIDLSKSANPQHRIPGIAPINRLYGAAPKWRKFQEALADAHVNVVEVAATRAQRLLRGLRVVTTDQPLDEFLALEQTLLTSIGIDDTLRTTVKNYGLGTLTLTHACSVAALIGCSLDWLAGCSIERGIPPTKTRLDTDTVESRRRKVGIASTPLREQLNLATGPYRRLMNGTDEPTLAELIAMSRALRTDPEQLMR